MNHSSMIVKKSKPQKTTYSIISFLEISKTSKATQYNIQTNEYAYTYINIYNYKNETQDRKSKVRDGGTQR